jgi:glycosyltransferase involved in cell wall biosynthesis
MISTSVVIPSFQGAERLEKLLSCLALQETDFDWEAVVVLDGSTDDSRQVVARWAEAIPVRLVDLGTNKGRPAALNAGFQAAQGRVLIRCDDDLAPDRHYLARHTRHHREREDVAVIGCYRNILPETPYAAAYGRHASQLSLQAAYDTEEGLRWLHWSGNCSATRSMFDRVGPYDEQFRAYGWEDVDWGYRLKLEGASFIIDPLLETDHNIASTTTAIRSRRAFLSGSAQARFLQKHQLSDIEGHARKLARSPWTAAVVVVARLPHSLREAFAHGVDRVGDHLPTGVTRKLIALCVESSGRAGLRAGANVSHTLSKDV